MDTGYDQGFRLEPVSDETVGLLARALQPLMAGFQERGVGVGEWIEAIKIASYEAAKAAMDAESGRAIFARMSVRTGMTRTELQQLRRQMIGGSLARPRRPGRQRTARVVEAWLADPRYCEADGSPRALSLDDAGLSLHTLIREHAGDVPTSSVIAELMRAQLLVQVVDGRYLPRRRSPEAGRYAARFERLMRAVHVQLNAPDC